MIEFSVDGIKCRIAKDNGLYVFNADSATGKSFLAKLVKDAIYSSKLKATVYNRERFVDGINLSSILENARDSILLVLDDMDFYNDIISDDIKQDITMLSTKAVVLVDAKYKPDDVFCNAEKAFIKLSRDKLEVY
jgi:hypothetical protein